jgi:chromosome segregation protein
MKGFKSFADNTVLEFEPGVTAVVGPNGSGKSNVVDAVTWVLGAQSTRALRSAKMDDVIFAGTAHRSALGRAEVALTLDNSSGRLPVDGAEVTISRTLFRNGDSEYAINATTCRLLDVQELLSDSGVGRHQHMIIGQGQLDSILNSSSESRRAVIEEAAGVLKHRRRKERAERRLAATQENLERLGDLVREVRRQMRPLERQAVSARTYADVQRELRVARQALFAERLEHFERRRRELDEAIESSATLERDLRHELVTLDAQATTAAAEMASRREEMLASTLGTLQGLAERARGTLSVIAERERSLRAALVASADENAIATLEADAARLATDLLSVDADEEVLRELREAAAAAAALYADARSTHESTWGSVSIEADESAWRTATERAALLERSRDAAVANEQRCAQRLADARRSVAEATAALDQVIGSRDAAVTDAARAAAELLGAEAAARDAEVERDAAEAALADASEHAARTTARAEALSRALEELSGAAGRAIVGGLDGVLGSFLDLIEVDEGWERAVESAAGASVGAMVVDGRRSAQAALEALRREGGVGLILAAAETSISPVSAPQGCVALRTLVRARAGAPAHVTRVLDALFSRAFVTETWREGIDVAVAHPDLVIVTRDGDRFAASGWRVASGRAVVTRSTVEDAQRAALDAAEALGPCRERRRGADAAAAAARVLVNEWNTARTRAEAELDRREREINRLTQQVSDGESRIAALAVEGELAEAERGVLDGELAQLRAQLPALERAVGDAGARRAAAEESRARVEELRVAAQWAATELGRREAEFAERRRLIEQRRAEIELRLEGRSLERAEAAGRRESLEFDVQVLGRLRVIVERAAEDIRLSQEAMDSTYREQLEASRASAERLEAVRHARQGADERLAQVADRAHRGQIELAELAVKVTNLHEAIRRDLGVEPHQLEVVDVREWGEGASLEARVGELEARISSLGPINPLALEELAALEQRYQELDAQVADVRHARRELQEVVRALDEEIMQTFSAAVADVNEHFSTLISMLFPGGQGRLILTEPDDPLNTGVEIEVRPMGRNVRRISLLSGGERSMAALAFLFAVFRSRPSPFYMMDEVEAALDDVNLQRFLSLVDEFRDEAQLLIVTHQKRTMEAADALYGVTMVPGASSKVVSQRVNRSPEEVSA